MLLLLPLALFSDKFKLCAVLSPVTDIYHITLSTKETSSLYLNFWTPGALASMDNRFSSPQIHTFPAGLRVLVVDDEPAWLKILEKMLRKCSYEVTTCGLATDALDMLRERKDRFDIVISDVNMPDMDGFKLLEQVGLEMDLPVIMMSVDGETSRVMKGVQHKACDFLLKPIRMKELQNIWQHVFRKKIHEVKDIESHDSDEDNQVMKNRLDEIDDGYILSRGDSSCPKKRKDMESEEHDSQDLSDLASVKKQRVVWSVDLHQRFVNAVNQIGFDKVGPKKILDLMDVPGLTRENVASHLQKYRLYLGRLQKQNESTASFCGINQTYFSSKDPPGKFGLQDSITAYQHNLLNNLGHLGDKSFVQEVPDIHQDDMKHMVSFVPATEIQRALTVDIPDIQNVKNASHMGFIPSFEGMVPTADDKSFGSTISQQQSWNGDIPVMPLMQHTEQRSETYPLSKEGYSHPPLPSQQHQILDDHLQTSPAVNTRAGSTGRDNTGPPQIKPLQTDSRSNHVRDALPIPCTIDSVSFQPKNSVVNPQGLEGMFITSGSSSTRVHDFERNHINGWESPDNSTVKNGSLLASEYDNSQLCSLQGHALLDNLVLNGLEFFDCTDGLRYCDYPIIDEGLYIM